MAPILLFTYKRLDTLQQTVESLQANTLAQDSELIVFSDGPRTAADKNGVEEVRSFVKTIRGFKSVIIKESQVNKGLAKSIIEGVSEVINQYNKVIVVEDDLVLTDNFLNFMNGTLDFYENDQTILSISGYIYNLKNKVRDDVDVFFVKRSCSWGWGTWKDRWQKVDWEVSDYESFSNSKQRQRQFNEIGSDLSHMLKKQMHGKMDSWSIRFTYHQFKYNLLTVYPATSKVLNNGFGSVATHTRKTHGTRFFTPVDTTSKKDFTFIREPLVDKQIMKRIKAHHSIKTRFIYKLRSILKF